MTQKILLVLVVAAALIYLGRYLYRQINAGRDGSHCDKCLPKDSLKNARDQKH
jgi:hypothetical protein